MSLRAWEEGPALNLGDSFLVGIAGAVPAKVWNRCPMGDEKEADMREAPSSNELVSIKTKAIEELLTQNRLF